MKTTRVGGGHPGYLVRQDPVRRRHRRRRGRPTSRTCGTTRSRGWSTPARCTASTPYYGPFGDIKDVVACEDQFRNAFLLGCVGAWSLHPVQIDDRQAGLQPRASRTSRTPGGSSRRWATAPARSCSTARWRTTPRVKQCLVIVELAEQLAAIDPELKAPTTRSRRPSVTRRDVPAPALGPLHAGSNERALEKAKTLAGRRDHLDLEDAVAPDAKGRRARTPCAAVGAASTARRELTIRVNGIGTQWHDDDLAPRPRPALTRSSSPRSTRADEVRALVAALEAAGAPEHTRSGRWSRRRSRSSTRARSRRRRRGWPCW